MKKKILSLIVLVCLLLPCCLIISACGSTPPDNLNSTGDSNSSPYSPKRESLTLNNYQQYITISPQITTASSGYNLVYNFSGTDYCSFENVVITYELFDYNILLNNPKVPYDSFVESYNSTLTIDGVGSTIRIEVQNYNWKIGVLSITGDVIINKDINNSNNSISLNLNNYQQYISFSQVSISNTGEEGMLYWNIQGIKNYAFVDVVITYDYFDYDFYGNEVIYDEFNYGYIGQKPYTCTLNLSGMGSTIYLDENEEYIKIISISGTLKQI